MKVITIMGDTYAGKTTHAKALIGEYGGDKVGYISSGDIARSLMDPKTKGMFSSGQLSPHGALICEQVKKRLFDYDRRGYRAVILDGFPRTVDDRELLAAWCKIGWPTVKPCALLLDVPLELIMARIGERRRDEFDSAEVVIKRHELFTNTTLPVFNGMDRDIWEKFAVRFKIEQPPNVVFKHYVDRIFRSYVMAFREADELR